MLTESQGYDAVYVDDISATISPDYATQMTRYNADGYGTTFPISQQPC